jgi:hypothetical protein
MHSLILLSSADDILFKVEVGSFDEEYFELLMDSSYLFGLVQN